MSNYIANTKVYTDINALQQLRYQADQHQQSVTQEVAEQFEAVFLQLAMKNMRQANQSFDSGLFASNGADIYQDLFDKQISLSAASNNKTGIANMLAAQIKKLNQDSGETVKPQLPMALQNASLPTPALNANEKTTHETLPLPFQLAKKIAAEPGLALQRTATKVNQLFNSKLSFVKGLWEDATKVAKELGVDPKFLIAQAALETGWGKRIIKHQNGENSFNLFGIKANSTWEGDKAIVKTTEYRQGRYQKEYAAFRSYDSFGESLQDYATFLQSNPRYQQALTQTHDANSFAKGLQQAGYATDPNYAKKIMSIMDHDVFNYVGQ